MVTSDNGGFAQDEDFDVVRDRLSEEEEDKRTNNTTKEQRICIYMMEFDQSGGICV